MEDSHDSDVPLKRRSDYAEILVELRTYALAAIRNRFGTEALGSNAADSDVAATVVREAIEKASHLRYESRAKFKSLVRVMAERRYLDKLRKKIRDDVHVAKQDRVARVDGESTQPVDPPSAGPGVLTDLVAREDERRLELSLTSLTETERAVLRLRRDGKKHEEICEVLGISIEMSWKLLSNLKKKLRRQLDA